MLDNVNIKNVVCVFGIKYDYDSICGILIIGLYCILMISVVYYFVIGFICVCKSVINFKKILFI